MTQSSVRVAVVGDALLDVDVDGSVSRICPDAPVPVFDERSLTARPGGAALAATLAARTGAAVTLVTALGADAGGEALQGLLAEEGVEVVDLRLRGATPEKVRFRADGHSLLRLDRGGPVGVRGGATDEALAVVRSASAVLVADYGRQVAAVDWLRAELSALRCPLVWDPHPRGGAPVHATTVVTPSRAELYQAVPEGPSPESALAATAERARTLVRRWGVAAAAVTMGPGGALLARAEGQPLVVPARRISAGDPCGAGDAFAATVATVLGAGALLPEAVEAATAAATDFVEAGGASAIRPQGADGVALISAGAARPTATTPGDVAAKPVLVATGGCFDLLHAGHVSLLEAAASLGDRLVVLLNSDLSVARLKGPDRPLQSEADRRAVLRALACVDDVVIFDEDTPARALEAVRPDVFVKGGDYTGADLPEAEVLTRWGGQVAIVPYLDGRSTTRLVKEARRGS